jgi:hypothetical protein
MSRYNPYLNPLQTLQNHIYAGAIGFTIELGLINEYDPMDISTATVKQIVIQSPDGTTHAYEAYFLTDGTDGILYYETIGGELNQHGTYGVQAYIEMPSFSGRSSIVEFEVYENLN